MEALRSLEARLHRKHLVTKLSDADRALTAAMIDADIHESKRKRVPGGHSNAVEMVHKILRNRNQLHAIEAKTKPAWNTPSLAMEHYVDGRPACEKIWMDGRYMSTCDIELASMNATANATANATNAMGNTTASKAAATANTMLAVAEPSWPVCTKACGKTYPRFCYELRKFLKTGCLKACSTADGQKIRKLMECTVESGIYFPAMQATSARLTSLLQWNQLTYN